MRATVKVGTSENPDQDRAAHEKGNSHGAEISEGLRREERLRERV